jgi:2'-5' RNA ligase
MEDIRTRGELETSPSQRVFVGLALDESNSAVLHERVSAVLDTATWKLHEREDYHATLCFLGEIAADRLPALRSEMALALRGLASPQLALRGVGFFGKDSSPRVLWAGVDAFPADLEHLIALRRATATAIAAAGLTWDATGAFNPHVTLARPRRRAALPERFTALAIDLPWRPVTVTLFNSVPGARPHYPHLESFALAA